ncbi:MAG: type I glyceraldehyde-3-phosphate dehydrogenase [Dehalococcoidia bacterium]|nr:type I glyceraldehyde-3-phosphate dehydrogenase [Dehalococcoidia bacterium]
MKLRVGINGFGRVGRLMLRAWAENGMLDRDDFEIVAINGRTDAEMHAHLLKYDTDYGRFPHSIETNNGHIVINDQAVIKVFKNDNPDSIPWDEAEVDVVIEATGQFKDKKSAEMHMKNNSKVKKVIITAPALDEDITIIMGVNQKLYDAEQHHIISAGSCTTNCIVPMIKVLHDNFEVTNGMMTTIHSYTRDQNLVDSKHKDLRRARAAASNIIPTSTGAANAISKIIPELENKINGMSFRVPTSTVSVVDLVTTLKKHPSPDDINNAFYEVAKNEMNGYLFFEKEKLVSSDFKKHSASCIFDSDSTLIVDQNIAKTIGWYDNEWGYACRIIDLCSLISRK